MPLPFVFSSTVEAAATVLAAPSSMTWACGCLCALAGLACLAANLLAPVHDALALVRLGRPKPSDVSGDLADGLLFDARHGELGLVLDVDSYALGRLELDGVRVAEAERDLIALLGDAVADSDQLEVLGVALVDPDDHVRDQAADEAVQRTVLVVVRRPLEHQLPIDLLDGDIGRQGTLELTLRSLDLHVAGLKRDLHRGRQLNRQLSNPRQVFLLTLLPDVRQHFTAQALAERLAPAHDSFGCAEDGDPEPAEDSRDLGLAGIDPQSGAADPLHARDHAHAIGAGLEDDTHPLRGAVGFDLVSGDVALVLEDAGDLELQPRGRHADLGVPGAVGVAHAREHVGDGIADDPCRRSLGKVLGCGRRCCHHQLDFVTPGMRPSAASVRKQIRHMPNLRRYARGRPQMRHRLCRRTLNFGCARSLFQRSSEDFFAKTLPYLFLNGIPSRVSRLRASSSERAVVTIDTSSPRSLSILS